MNLFNKMAKKAIRFVRDNRGIAAMTGTFSLVVVAGVAGGAIDMTAYQTQKNTVVAVLNSAGNFASLNNTCVGTSTAQIAACTLTLNTLTNNYVASTTSIGVSSTVPVQVTTGLWCVSNGSGSFVPNSGSSPAQCSPQATSSSAAVQVSSTASVKPSFLKFVGVSSLTQNIKLTISNNRIDQFTGTQVCPGVMFDSAVFTRSDGSKLTWDPTTRTPAYNSTIKVTFGKTWSYSDSIGTVNVQNGAYLYNATPNNGNSPYFPQSETSSNVTSRELGSPSSTSYKIDGSNQHGVYTGSFQTNPSDLGKTVYDPDLGSNRAANDWNTFALRQIKKMEGKSCLALIGSGSQSDTKTVKGAVMVYINHVCDGSRRYDQTNKVFVPTKWDKSGDDLACVDSGSANYVTPSIEIRIGAGRGSDNIVYTPTNYSTVRGYSNGSGNQIFGVEGGPKKVADQRS